MNSPPDVLLNSHSAGADEARTLVPPRPLACSVTRFKRQLPIPVRHVMSLNGTLSRKFLRILANMLTVTTPVLNALSLVAMLALSLIHIKCAPTRPREHPLNRL